MTSASQGFLFDRDPAPWEIDDASQTWVASVVFPEGVSGVYDYAVPEPLRESIQPGVRVRVPLGRGNRLVTGYCVEVDAGGRPRRPLKPVAEVLDAAALLSPCLLELTRWMSQRYLCPLGRVLEGVVPGGVRRQAGLRRQLVLWPADGVPDDLDSLGLPAKQLAVMRRLKGAEAPLTIDQLTKAARCGPGVIRALRKRKLVVGKYQHIQPLREADPPPPRPPDLTLNDQQQAALDAVLGCLHRGEHRTFVLFGVTGSGKTEVYIRSIEEVIRFGRQAIVLVPEISLTPQTLRRFRARFPRVAVLHSHLSDAERHWHWQRIARGEVQVVVGARSAVFAPTPHLGLIVLDEEHDASFKQDSAPRYHAREVARRRAIAERIPLLLGSATPSLETWHAALQGEYELLRIPTRVLDRQLPEVETIDLRLEYLAGRWRGAISRPLERAMQRTLQDGGQVILLLNRRGFSTHIQCVACGHVVRCRQCDVALTLHRDEFEARCHYCDSSIRPPDKCPACGFVGIRYSGTGTQRLEAEVKARFPSVPALRMDSDSMRRLGSHDRALALFREGKVQILLGTQMIAKGLDFPRVTLVGVVHADVGLHLPDFRAGERTFQLVTQVAGRTGRGPWGGRVLVQTLSPQHPAIEAASRHDFEAFAAWELPNRQSLGYPPFGEIIRFVLRGPRRDDVQQAAENLGALLRDVGGSARLLGPAPAPITRLRGQYRFHLVLQAPRLEPLLPDVQRALDAFTAPDGVQWIADVDPHHLL